MNTLNPNLDITPLEVNFITNTRAIIYGSEFDQPIPVFNLGNIYRPATDKEIAENNESIINIKPLNQIHVNFRLENKNDDKDLIFF